MPRPTVLSIIAGAAILATACVRAERPVITAPATPTAQAASAREFVGRLPDSVVVFVDGKELARADIAAIPTSSIENVEVLKGAYAVTMYGDRARNGVILITTKASTRKP